ncbi:MAG: ATP-binding domain-containing protein [Planctomycetes bacterium]|nr:ATP-binding domain-containing protein [Planctomycetota bacterium]
MSPSQFFPNTPPSSSSHSELEVFQALQATLASNWTVFSPVHWTHRNSKGKYHDGEADFVLFHPRFGLLVLEVKGGGIEFDPQTGKWFTIPVGEPRKRLGRSPFTQARSNLYSIIKILRRRTGEYNLPFNWGYGVVFPNVVDLSGLENQHPQAPKGITACANDLAFLGEWCERLGQGWLRHEPDYFGDLGAHRSLMERDESTPMDSVVDFVREALCPKVSLPTAFSLRKGIEREHEEIIQLSAQQCKVLSPLQRNRRLAVRGGAGTGKTLLALHKALSFARQGVPTLLTCFNRVLAESMLSIAKVALKASKDEWVLESDYLKVQTLPDYAAKIVLGSAGKAEEQDAEFWRTLPETFAAWCDQNDLPPELALGAVMLDEGQDFGAAWWKVIPRLLENPEEDYLWVFFDNNQAIYAEGLGDDARAFLPGAAEVDLNENFRNTREIHAAFQKYNAGEEQRALGPAGRAPECVKVKDVQEQENAGGVLEAVGQVVKRLVEQDGIAPEKIAVLTPSRSASVLFVEELGGYATQTSGKIQAGRVVVETIHSFKGQESQVVVLAEMALAPDDQAVRLRYVAMSRAVHHLVLVV